MKNVNKMATKFKYKININQKMSQLEEKNSKTGLFLKNSTLCYLQRQ